MYPSDDLDADVGVARGASYEGSGPARPTFRGPLPSRAASTAPVALSGRGRGRGRPNPFRKFGSALAAANRDRSTDLALRPRASRPPGRALSLVCTKRPAERQTCCCSSFELHVCSFWFWARGFGCLAHVQLEERSRVLR